MKRIVFMGFIGLVAFMLVSTAGIVTEVWGGSLIDGIECSGSTGEIDNIVATIKGLLKQDKCDCEGVKALFGEIAQEVQNLVCTPGPKVKSRYESARKKCRSKCKAKHCPKFPRKSG